MIGPGSGNGRSCKWSQKPSKYINSGDEFYCVSTNIEEIFLELNDNVSFQQKIWTLLRFYDINSSSCSVAFIVYFVCSRRRVIRHCCFCQVGRLCVRETPRAVCEQWPNIWAGAPWSNIWYESPCALPNICFILRLCLEWQHIDRENRLFALTSWASLLPIVRHCWPVCCN